jgi:hypothetical protein
MSRSLSKNAGNRSVENQPKRSLVEMHSQQMKPGNGAGSVSDLNCIPVREWGRLRFRLRISSSHERRVFITCDVPTDHCGLLARAARNRPSAHVITYRAATVRERLAAA